MKALRLLAVGVCVTLAVALSAQEVLTNDSVVKMVRAHLSDDVIVALIQNQAGNYDLSSDTLIDLKRKGVANKILAAMAAKGAQKAIPAASVAVPAAVAVVDPYGDLDSGVYRRLRDRWIQLKREQVDWKTSSVAKSVASAGVIKTEVNGRLIGGASPTQVQTPVEFLIKAPDGVQGTDYLLVHLAEKADSREFRRTAHGVFHTSGGILRDEIAFDQTKVASRTYKLTVPDDLPPGEYAFLVPAANTSSITGYAYTFRIVE